MSKPFAVLCHSPELLRDVDTGPLESLEALQSFEAWVRKHGQHMRRLSFDCSAARRDALSGQVDSAFSACLEAAGAAAGPSLVQLTAVRSGIGTHSTEWLPAFPSLRRLELRGLLRISPAICSLTALESLHLQGFSVVFEEEVSLPPSLTQLHLRTPFAYELPDQVSGLELILEGSLWATSSRWVGVLLLLTACCVRLPSMQNGPAHGLLSLSPAGRLAAAAGAPQAPPVPLPPRQLCAAVAAQRQPDAPGH